MDTPKWWEIIEQLVREGAPVAILPDDGGMRVGVLEDMPETVDYLFEPVALSEIETLGGNESEKEKAR